MRSDKGQLDLLTHSDEAMAKACRVAADAALLNPYESMEQREKRRAAMLLEAARYDRLVSRNNTRRMKK